MRTIRIAAWPAGGGDHRIACPVAHTGYSRVAGESSGLPKPVETLNRAFSVGIRAPGKLIDGFWSLWRCSGAPETV